MDPRDPGYLDHRFAGVGAGFHDVLQATGSRSPTKDNRLLVERQVVDTAAALVTGLDAMGATD